MIIHNINVLNTVLFFNLRYMFYRYNIFNIYMIYFQDMHDLHDIYLKLQSTNYL